MAVLPAPTTTMLPPQAGLDLLFHALHPLDDALHVAFNVELAGLPRAHGEEDMGVAHLLELFDGRQAGAELDLDAVASP